MPDTTLPDGHPIPWDQLKPYEQHQGGYWLYGPHCDVYGNGKQWVPVPRPEEPGELDSALRQIEHLAARIGTRAKETSNADMAALAAAVLGASKPGVQYGFKLRDGTLLDFDTKAHRDARMADFLEAEWQVTPLIRQAWPAKYGEWTEETRATTPGAPDA
jgi:hypothetical protein